MYRVRKIPSKFSRLELEILKRLSIGLSDKEISKTLKIDEKLLDEIITRLFVVFNVKSRIDLGMKAIPLFSI